MSERKRILVVKLSSIGDVVQALPVAGALRRRFPEAYIAWAVGPAAADVVTGNPHLSEVLIIGGSSAAGERVRSLPPLAAPMRLRRTLRAIGFDTALDLQGLFKSAAVAYLSGARERIGFRSLHEGISLLNNRSIIRERRDVHAVESYLDFAGAMGAPREPVEFALAISPDDREAVDRLLSGRDGAGISGRTTGTGQEARSCSTGGKGEFAALVPGARWKSKLWPTERFAVVADGLAREFRLAPVLVGASGDAALASEIERAARAEVLDLTGKTTLKQAAEVFRRCRVTVGNDTGPLYLSAAVGTPTVAVFGPTDWRRLGPYGDGHAKVIAEVECAPCRNRECRHRKCMEAVQPEQVMAAVRRLLAEGRRES